MITLLANILASLRMILNPPAMIGIDPAVATGIIVPAASSLTVIAAVSSAGGSSVSHFATTGCFFSCKNAFSSSTFFASSSVAILSMMSFGMKSLTFSFTSLGIQTIRFHPPSAAKNFRFACIQWKYHGSRRFACHQLQNLLWY